MEPGKLDAFLEEIRAIGREFVQPADIVLEGAPIMYSLLHHADDFLNEDHLRPCDTHYARNQVYSAKDGSLSLFVMVWSPGQWTPVHDHGTWGMVGVLRGALQERNFIRVDPREREDSGVILRRGGISVLGKGSVATFVPNPDHIHRTGVPRDWGQAVTLHLYGRNMSNYNRYDLELGRRVAVDVHTDSIV